MNRTLSSFKIHFTEYEILKVRTKWLPNSKSKEQQIYYKVNVQVEKVKKQDYGVPEHSEGTNFRWLDIKVSLVFYKQQRNCYHTFFHYFKVDNFALYIVRITWALLESLSVRVDKKQLLHKQQAEIETKNCYLNTCMNWWSFSDNFIVWHTNVTNCMFVPTSVFGTCSCDEKDG